MYHIPYAYIIESILLIYSKVTYKINNYKNNAVYKFISYIFNIRFYNIFYCYIKHQLYLYFLYAIYI